MNDYESTEEHYISDFLIYDDLLGSVALYMFQAGAWAFPAFTRNNMLISTIEFASYVSEYVRDSSKPIISTDLCKVLVIEKLHKFETRVTEFRDFLEKHKEKEVPSIIKDPLVEFLK